MPATALTKACARSMKAWAKSLGLNARTECGKSVATRPQWVSVWIKSEPIKRFNDPIVYKGEFPHADRARALTIVYGRDLSINDSASAGNIRPHSMAMAEFEWVKFFENTKFAVTIPTTPASIEEAPVH